jgi:hypothetical protein
LKATLSPIVAAAAALAPVPDRQTIARIVEQVFTARGIPRRASSTVSSLDVRQSTPEAASKSGNLADAGVLAGAPSFAPSAKSGDFASPAPPSGSIPFSGGRSFSSDNRAEQKDRASAPEVQPPPAPPHPLPPPVEVAEFLSENDVRMALTRNRKLYIGPKTILTPSARDLGNDHEIFIMTDIIPAPKKRYSE